MRRAPWALAGALALSLACELPSSSSCPGDRVAQLQFQAALDASATTCGFARSPDAGLDARDFAATLAWTPQGSAALCPDKDLAEPLTGSRDGDHVLVALTSEGATVAGCSCNVSVREELEGVVTGADGGAPSFSGELRNVLSPSAGAALDCSPDGGPVGSCVLPCLIRWGVQTR